ncbi:hypothetical protein [Pseudomonas sp. OA65]|uniref:hypothetical protein n=1 Tax=Pseudomonas sp. OA65 TaxID=2818431 RepID=UPI001A9F04A5|nr:hypothetical protein [Pseudomonas sp. OA65]MBO1540861.1 hypothetical protein [Pseudomonas sp. OA65]
MNTQTRLTSVAPDLVEWGASLPATRRKNVACAAAQWACTKSNAMALHHELPLKQMLQPTYIATEADRQRLAQKADDLDEKYYSTVDPQVDSNAADGDLTLFEQARAITCVLYAFDADELSAFYDALYEAQAVTDDVDELRQLCRT